MPGWGCCSTGGLTDRRGLALPCLELVQMQDTGLYACWTGGAVPRGVSDRDGRYRPVRPELTPERLYWLRGKGGRKTRAA